MQNYQSVFDKYKYSELKQQFDVRTVQSNKQTSK